MSAQGSLGSALTYALSTGLLVLGLSCSGSDPSVDGQAAGGTGVGSVSRDSQTLVLFVVDGLARGHLGAYGYSLGRTPHLDGLADQGIVFENHISVSTGVTPALASLLTGLFPRGHGVGSLQHRGQQALAQDQTTLAETLQGQGWNTMGLVSIPQLLPDLCGLDQGFNVWMGPGLHEGERRSADQVILGAKRELLGAFGAEGSLFVLVHLSDPATSNSIATEAAWPFLEKHLGGFRSTRPLIAAALDRIAEDPKGGADELERLLRRGRGSPAFEALTRAKYDGAVATVDAAIGEVLGWLGQAGRLEGATIAITATRGARLKPAEPGSPAFSDELVATPLLVRFPGGVPKARIRGLVRSIDLVPSLFASLGIEFEVATGGVNWLPLIEEGRWSGPTFAICETANQDQRAAIGAGLSLEENRVAGRVSYRRDLGRRVLAKDLAPAEVNDLAELNRALDTYRQPAHCVLETGGRILDARWEFTSGFAGEARVTGLGEPRVVRTRGLSGQAKLTADDRQLWMEGSRREVPMRLRLSGVEGCEELLHLGQVPLDESLMPRLPVPQGEAWPTDEVGAYLPAAVVLEQQGGEWWKLHVHLSDTDPEPFTALVALYPPGPHDMNIDWSADPKLDVQYPPGREDVILVSGMTPCSIQIKKSPTQSFGLAVLGPQGAVPTTSIRMRSRSFGSRSELSLYFPDWLAPVSNELLWDPETPDSEGQLQVSRRGPNLSADNRRALSPEQRTFARRLGGRE